MYVIAGATGNTGGVVASTLLEQGKSVTVLVRDAQKAEGWRKKGAQVAVAALDDAKAVGAVLAGAEGAYLLLPPNYATQDMLATNRQVAEALGEAVKASGVGNVVFLSSIGAQHAEGTGPIRGLHHGEKVFAAAAKNVAFVRAAYFLQNWAPNLAGARADGVLHNFLTPDRKIPMVSVVDIGRVAARYLVEPANGRRVVELAGPEDYSPRDIAKALAAALGKPVKLETHPVEAAVPTLAAMGVPESTARLFAEMLGGINSGHVDYEGAGAKFERGSLTAAEAIGEMLGQQA
jgi:uncharacterized protein YbjT (DUF2867 family)